jgi:AcrR family transcriptional regulator
VYNKASKVNRGLLMQYLKDNVKSNIVESALLEFKEKGYAGASMRVIAHNAQITSGNIYRYFSSKEKLFDFLINPVYDQTIRFGEKFKNEVLNNKVNFINFDSMELIKEIYRDILESFSEHGRELLILLDKSEGTKFSGTKENLKLLINQILKEVYLSELKNQGKEVKDELILYVISSSLVEGIGDILRNCNDGNRIRLLVEAFAEIIFHDLSKRI